MRRLIASFILLAMFILPVISSCVPSGYEKGTENPARPPGQRPIESEGAGDLPDQPEDTGDTGDTDEGGE